MICTLAVVLRPCLTAKQPVGFEALAYLNVLGSALSFALSLALLNRLIDQTGWLIASSPFRSHIDLIGAVSFRFATANSQDSTQLTSCFGLPLFFINQPHHTHTLEGRNI